ncbi:MAG TPA: alkaline phosphatase family protein [Candidatus Angelobacter sp.]|nr:alkaline phosphatase family protein [Candidatus Angelobacter sp.]
MNRSKGFLTPVQFSLFAFILLAFLSGCGSVSGSTGGGPSQAVIAMAVAPDTIVQGQSTTLSWQVTNAASFSISPPVASGTLPLTGSAAVSPSQTTTFVATATDSQGRTATKSIMVTVVPQGSAPSMTISISPTVVAAGQTTALTWASTNATTVSIAPSILADDQTVLALSGSATVVINAPTTYTATATGAGGVTAKSSATVNVLNVTLTATPATIGAGQTATLSWTTNIASGTTLSIDQGIGAVNGPSGSLSVSPAATTTYTITATNGTAVATATATVNAPLSVTLTANPINIAPGGQSSLSWVSRGATSLSIDNGVGSVTGANGSVSVSPSQSTTYTITATDGQGNSTTAAATVSVGTNTGLQGIKHIIVILQENRSFDSYFAHLAPYVASKHPEFGPYQINAGYDPNILLPLSGGGTGHLFHEPTVRTENLSPAWNESHFDIDQQSDGTFKMDRFAITTHSVAEKFDPSGLRALGQYDETDLPYYYELAAQFATSDSFHSSMLANTVTNRQYAFCATSQGRIFPSPQGAPQWTCPTIFSSLQNAGVSWAYYYTDSIFLPGFTDWNNLAIQHKTAAIQNYFNVLATPTADSDLPSVVWIDPGFGGSGLDEHPDNNVQKGAAYIKTLIDALMNSPAWHDSVFILAYDEGGGLYDHVPPFTVVPPDNIPPQLGPGDATGDNFTLSGFRLPMVVVSPFVKPHFVSHVNRETTSILKLIETRFNLPPLTARDAAADDMTEFFDFVNPPAFLTPPPLPVQPTTGVDDPSKEAPPQ